MNLLGWVCKMKIINYNKKKKVLSVKYNTKTIWDYQDVSEDMYNTILNSDSSERELRILLSELFIVGVNKEVK